MAYALVISTTKASVNSNSVTTDAVDTTGADLLCLFASGTYLLSETPTDSKSNTWVATTATTVVSGETGILWYAKNPTVGGSHTFSITATGKLPSLCMAAFSGANITGPLDKQNQGTGYPGNVSSGSVTPSAANALIVSGCSFNVTSTVMSVSSPYTITDQTTRTASAMGGALAYRIMTDAAETAASWDGDVSTSIACMIATFHVLGGGGGAGGTTGTTPPCCVATGF